MKERTVVMTFEIPTDLPVKVLREADIAVPRLTAGLGSHIQLLRPVNKPRVEVIQQPKAKGKRR